MNKKAPLLKTEETRNPKRFFCRLDAVIAPLLYPEIREVGEHATTNSVSKGRCSLLGIDYTTASTACCLFLLSLFPTFLVPTSPLPTSQLFLFFPVLTSHVPTLSLPTFLLHTSPVPTSPVFNTLTRYKKKKKN